MKAFSGYEEVKVNNFGERLKLGGHICKVLDVKIEEIESKKDNKKFEMMVIKFDIEKPDEQAGFYANKFADDAQANALEAKWKGFHRISIPTDDSEDFIKSKFKAFTTSIEESNPGYKWNWEENTLIGKVFGGVFGFEEFVTQEGKTITMTKIRYVKSTDKIEEVAIPKVKLADNTLIEYTEYVAMKKAEREGTKNNSSTSNTSEFETSSLDTDDLPF